MRLLTFILLSTVSLTACTSFDRKDQTSTVPKLTFAQLQPLPVDVGQVVVNTAVPDQSGTNPIAHTPLAQAFSDYAHQRFVGMGGPGAGTLTVTLNETRVSKGTKNTDNKWVAWTNLDKVDGYMAAVKATFRYDSADKSVFKEAVLRQERGIDIPQRTTLAERQLLEQQLIEKLIADFDKQAIPALQSNLQILGAGVAQ